MRGTTSACAISCSSLAALIAFFAVAALFVRACELVLGPSASVEDGARVSTENAIGLVLAVAVLGYLVYALLAPEKLG